MLRLTLPTLLLAIATQGLPVTPVQLQRAEANYRALVNGRKQLSELSPIELKEVQDLLSLARRTPSIPPDTKTRCLEREASNDNPSHLEREVLDLKCSQRPD
jgi:hypothetical protein